MEIPPDEDEVVQSRLSRISTVWTMLASAHEGSKTEAATARLAFVQRYQRAVYRYLLAAARDVDAADDLFQELVLRFVRGDFQHADPEKGRFRDYLKTTLSHLVVDYHRQQQRLPAIRGDVHAMADQTPANEREFEAEFWDNWRNELLDRAWEKLEHAEQTSGTLSYTVLRYRSEHPDENSSDIALQLTIDRNLQPGLTPENVRKLLQRARQQFADHLLDEVAGSLQQPAIDEIEQELIELDLLRFCRGAVRRRKTEGD